MAGTRLYYAPDLTKPPYSASVDIFSLGITFYETLFTEEFYSNLIFGRCSVIIQIMDYINFFTCTQCAQTSIIARINKVLGEYKKEQSANKHQEQINTHDRQDVYSRFQKASHPIDVEHIVFALVAMLQVLYFFFGCLFLNSLLIFTTLCFCEEVNLDLPKKFSSWIRIRSGNLNCGLAF